MQQNELDFVLLRQYLPDIFIENYNHKRGKMMEAMQTWIEKLDNPFVLVGFVVFILGSVIVAFSKKSKQKIIQTSKGDDSPNLIFDNTKVKEGGIHINLSTSKNKNERN